VAHAAAPVAPDVEQADGAGDPAGGADVQSGAQDTTGVDTAEASGAGEAASAVGDPAGGADVQPGAPVRPLRRG